MRTLLPLAILLATLAPVAAAATPLDDAEWMEVTLRDSGSLVASAVHDLPDKEFLRESSLRVDWTVEADYMMFHGAVHDPDVFLASEPVRLRATGEYSYTQRSRSSSNAGKCTLDFDKDVSSSAFMVVSDGKLALSSQRIVAEQTWTCTGEALLYAIPTPGFAAGLAASAADGSFPAKLAVQIGLANDEAQWTSMRPENRVGALLGSGYLEAEPTLGTQTIPYSSSLDADDDVGGPLCGGKIQQYDATSKSCEVTGTATLTLAPGGEDGGEAVVDDDAPDASAAATRAGTPARAENADLASDANTNDTPGVGVIALLAAALFALAFRRRA